MLGFQMVGTAMAIYFIQCKCEIQWGLEFRTFEYQIHSKTEHFEGPFSNGQPFENGPFEIRTMASLYRFI